MPNEYMTESGDVWDLISWRVYRDEAFISQLINANPDKRHIVKFNGNVIMKIPDMPEAVPYSAINMPPWKR